MRSCRTRAWLTRGGGARVHGWGAAVCKYAVHKECYPTGGHTCQEVAAAQRTRPVIFMAADETDCERWLSNLVALRDSVSSGSFSDGVGSGLPSPTSKS